MKRSILPGFIKRRSIGNIKEVTNGLDFLKESDKTIHRVVDTEKEKRFFKENYGLSLEIVGSNQEQRHDLVIANNNSQPGSPLSARIEDENINASSDDRRHSLYEGIFRDNTNINIVISNHSALYNRNEYIEGQMVDQEDIIALTRHVRSFSDALNNLRNTFKESSPNGVYNETECQSVAHSRLSEVLKILKEILAKYPPLHSPDILSAAANIIRKIKTYNYADGQEGPTDYYAAIDQLALSFSSSVSDFLLGDKEMASPNSPHSNLDQDEDGAVYHDEYDPKFFPTEDDDKNESEDSLDQINSYDLLKGENGDSPSSPSMQKISSSKDISIQRTDELDRTLLSIEGSVEIALQRTKVWAKYAKDILSYLERRSNHEMECSKQIAKLALQTRNSIFEESYLPFQSIFMTALDNDIHFANNYHKNCQMQLQSIVDQLGQRQKDHDTKRSKIKAKWKNELKKLSESRDYLRAAKKLYVQKQKDLEKFNNKQQQEGKEGFSIGKKKGQVDFKKSAEESEEQYKQCVIDANFRQQELERTKSESLIELRQLVYQCDLTMKSITIAYFQMMDNLYNPLPVQYRTLAESCKNYEEGQQFADFVRLQQSTSNQAMCPTYHFEFYRGDLNSSMRHTSDNNVLSISSEDYSTTTPGAQPRRASVNSDQTERPKQAWGSLPRNKGSATDDTDSLSSRSLPGSPQASPSATRKPPTKTENELYSDEEHTAFKEALLKSQNVQKMPAVKNQKLSAAAKTHKYRRLRSAAKCKECDSYVYFNGNECERCGLICHKKCLEKLAIKCGNKRLPRKMTTFGIDFHQHLAATKRKDIPYIMEKCMETINENGLSVKGLYRVSGVKSKVEKLCQQFETGGDLVDLSSAPPHLVASVLKLYLRQLPEPLLTFTLYHSFINIAKDSMNLNLSVPAIDDLNETDANTYEEIIKTLHDIVKSLPSANFYTAAKLIRHLKRVANNSGENQMSAANIAIVFGPTLLRPEGDPNSLSAVMDMPHQTRAVELLILNSHIFSVVEEGEQVEFHVTAERYRPSNQKKKRIDTVPENPVEHKRDDSNISVGQEFSQELLFIMESSQKRMDEDRSKNDAQPVLPGQTINDDYDNLKEDVVSDLPPAARNKVSSRTQVSTSESTDYESANSRLSSVESLLSGDAVSFGSQSPVELPDSSRGNGEDDDDDVWMNRFGKEPLKKSLSVSAAETVPVSAETFGLPVKKKKTSSNSRLETTTYSFSIGNSSGDQIAEDEPPLVVASDSQNISVETEPSNWVTRDSKDRVPVRKHLKAVNVKATINVADQLEQSSSPNGSPKVVRSAPHKDSLNSGDGIAIGNTDLGIDIEKNISNNRHSSATSSDSEKDARQQPLLTVKVDAAQQQQRNEAIDENVEVDNETPKSPSKQAPMVLPKPKKPLDKKSWTADLIKSKTQNIPDQPQPGSLNEKLLHRRKTDDDQSMERTSSIGKKSSVKEILNRFQSTDEGGSNEQPNRDNDSPSPSEKYV